MDPEVSHPEGDGAAVPLVRSYLGAARCATHNEPVTAGLAASALLGAPLGHDHAYISLSDLHTPLPVILRPVRAAAEGDFFVLFYNPRSPTRDWQLGAALALLAEHRPAGHPGRRRPQRQP